MVDLDNLSIESGEQGFTLNVPEGIKKITDKQLFDALGDTGVARINQLQLQLAKKKEQYEELKPVGFEYAPESVKKYRVALKNKDNVQKMQYWHDNVSYNAYHTINIFSLKKTFCEDISGNKQTMNFNDAKKLATSKGYKLMTDYNDTDAEEIKKQSDWYKVINLFSGNKGDTTEGMELFRDMVGCNYGYWTDTPYKDEKGKEIVGIVCSRTLDEDECSRDRGYADGYARVCGFKDMN